MKNRSLLFSLLFLIAIPSRAKEQVMRVSLGRFQNAALTVSAPSGVEVDGKKMEEVVVAVKNGGLSGGAKKLEIRPVREGEFLLFQGKRKYRGTFTILKTTKGVVVVNHVPMNDYLYGVLPYEMACDWPLEALKAQAVISRTYALKSRGSYEGYDVTDDIMSQVYRGTRGEKPPCLQAVDDTGSEVIKDSDGRLADVYFHALCGGCTEKLSDVWLGLKNNPPYLIPVKDPYCKGQKYYDWSAAIPEPVMRKKLLEKGKLHHDSEITAIKPLEETDSGRYRRIRVKTRKETVEMVANTFRIAMNPSVIRSTKWEKVKEKDGVFHFEGHGWGHGVALCQDGAKVQAEKGRDYKEILEFYLPGTKVEAR